MDDARWTAALAKAEAEGTTMADVLRDAIDRFLLAKPKRHRPVDPAVAAKRARASVEAS